MWIRRDDQGWWRVFYRNGSATKPLFTTWESAYRFALAIGVAPDNIA